MLVTPKRFLDGRVFFSETWNESRFAAAGIPGPFVQDNHACSAGRGVVRGPHLQISPNVRSKLVRAVQAQSGIWQWRSDRARQREAAMSGWCCRRRTGGSFGSQPDCCTAMHTRP